MPYIQLTRGQFALVDDEDYQRLLVFNWQAHLNRSTGKFIAERFLNAVKQPNGKWKNHTITMQEEIMGKRQGLEIDHKNMDTLDNRRSNLRHCTRSQNSCNRGLRSDNSLGVKGVFRNNTGKFTTRVVVNGQRKSVGTFRTLNEAATAYDLAATKHYGEFARHNGIESEG